MNKFLPYLILVAALTVSGSAAFYSVFGLGKLFAGASVQVMIMAGSLEFAKLVMATALHRYWKSMNRWMRYYLTLALVVLIGITSAGIYGFLSSAYQVTAVKDQITTNQITVLELKKTRFTVQHNDFTVEKDEIIKNISDMRKSISNPNQVQYVDKRTGQLVTTSSEGSRKAMEKQLTDAVSRRDHVSIKIEAAADSMANMDVLIAEAKANSETSTELGPLKYLSGLTGKPMDQIVNWFLMLLIFVFDPLAVTLIILANFAFEKVYGKRVMDSVIRGKPVKLPTMNNPSGSSVKNTFLSPGVFTREFDINVSPGFNYPPPVGRKIIYPDDISTSIEKSISDNKELSDSQRKNMTHQEIEQWYRENSL